MMPGSRMDSVSATWLAPAVIAAVIAAIASFVLSAVNVVAASRTLAAQHQAQLELEKYRRNLADLTAERDARRAYEYDARKSLYTEIEPLLFQLVERSESALTRIEGLARAAREGKLGPEEPGWLTADGYYLQSTLYRLIAPVALFKFIQRRLTLVDLRLDPAINVRYQLAKQVYQSFADSFDLAKLDPRLPYAPYDVGYDERQSNPGRHRLQGVPIGDLEIAAEALLFKDDFGQLACMSFGQFQAAYEDTAGVMCSRFAAVTDIIRDFHPQTRPVFWRVLIVQAHLYRALTRLGPTGTLDASMISIPAVERDAYEWRQPGAVVNDALVLVEPFAVAERYLEQAYRRANARIQ